jgi:pilus assembly protein Flp/PilA
MISRIASEGKGCTMKRLLNSLIFFEEGATAAEYAIMVSLVVVVLISAVGLFGINTNNMFQLVAGKYPK